MQHSITLILAYDRQGLSHLIKAMPRETPWPGELVWYFNAPAQPLPEDGQPRTGVWTWTGTICLKPGCPRWEGDFIPLRAAIDRGLVRFEDFAGAPC